MSESETPASTPESIPALPAEPTRASQTAPPAAKNPKAKKPKKAPKSKKPAKPLTHVVFHAYPKFIFAWPIILAGLILWPVVGYWNADAEICGWIYLLVLTLTLLTLGIDLERDHAVFWLVVFLAFFFLGKWLSSSYEGFTFFGNIYRYLANIDVQYSPALGQALSFLLIPPYLVMLIYARLQHRWRITHNEFEHYSWGRADDSLARGAKRVRSTYPDLLEFLLCGAGTLIVYSATGRTELRRIPHVPFIFLVRRRINTLLESTSVVHHHDELIAEEADDEADERESESNAHSSGNEPL